MKTVLRFVYALAWWPALVLAAVMVGMLATLLASGLFIGIGSLAGADAADLLWWADIVGCVAMQVTAWAFVNAAMVVTDGGVTFFEKVKREGGLL